MSAALAAVLLLTVSPTVAGAPAPTLELGPCELAGLPADARCGRYEVWENRAVRRGRRIELAVVVLPATGGDPLPDALFTFAGGPGDSVIRNAAGLAELYAPLRERRDLLLVDVRGTGRSTPLDCPPAEAGDPFGPITEFLPAEMVRRCRAMLAADHDLTQYHTAWAVDDVEEIRRALGYDQLNILGGSYGTRATSVYMRRHPQAVRTAVMYGMAPVNLRLPLTFARDVQSALDGVFALCAADEACRGAFPGLRDSWDAAMRRLESGPLPARVRDAQGDEIDVEVTRTVFVQTVRYMLYGVASAARLPLAVHRAAQGDADLIARYAVLWGSFLGGTGDGFYLSVTCPEDVARIDEAEIADAVAGSFLGDYRIRQQQAACALWPHATLPESFWQPVRSDVPALIVSGELDPVTPAYWGQEAARHLPHSLHVIVPHGAHDQSGMSGIECVEALARDLIRSGRIDGLDTGCLSELRYPEFDLGASEDAPVVALEVDQLERLAGRYASTSPPIEIEFTVRDGKLFVHPPGAPEPVLLEATAERHFRPAVLPFPITFEFADDGGSVVVDQGGQTIELQRVRP